MNPPLKELPSIDATGRIEFADRQQFGREYHRYLKHGAIYVDGGKMENMPGPQEFLQVSLVIPYQIEDISVTLYAEVRSRTERRALLAFVMLNQEVRTQLAAAAESDKSRKSTPINTLDPVVAALANAALWDDEAEDEELDLHREIDRLCMANYFDRLGVHWMDHPKLIEERYNALDRLYSREAGGADHQTAQHVKELIAEAYNILRDKVVRCDYRTSLFREVRLELASKFAARCCTQAIARGRSELAGQWRDIALELCPGSSVVAQLANIEPPV